MTQWTQAEAIELCRAVEAVCPEFGCHVALTGGVLYKDGPRKDLDLLFYRHRQSAEIDVHCLWGALDKIGLTRNGQPSGYENFCQKATFRGKPVDCLFPEFGDGYPELPGGVIDPFAILHPSDVSSRDWLSL